MNGDTADTPVDEKRGGCLTTLLVLMFVANPLCGAFYLMAPDAIRSATPGISAWALLILGILGFANLALALATWHWRRWGVYGLGVSSAIAFWINATYIGLFAAVIGLLGLGLLVLLVAPHWRGFR